MVPPQEGRRMGGRVQGGDHVRHSPRRQPPDGDAPAQQKQLRERQQPPDVFTNTLFTISVLQAVTALIRTIRSGGL